MPLFGSHLSISGGYYKAVEAAAELGLDAVQLFTKNNNQWAAKELSDDDVKTFRDAIERTGKANPFAARPGKPCRGMRFPLGGHAVAERARRRLSLFGG